MAAREERAERREQLAPGTDVVVDDVEEHREPGAVGGVDEAREPLRAAVGAVRRVHEDAVVAPAALAGKGGDRHQLDRGDAEVGELAQPPGGRVERPLSA